MQISYSKNFIKQAKKLNPKQRKLLQHRIHVFIENSQDSRLHNHQLKGEYKKYCSINIGGDLRALYVQFDEEIQFDIVGTHSQLY